MLHILSCLIMWHLNAVNWTLTFNTHPTLTINCLSTFIAQQALFLCLYHGKKATRSKHRFNVEIYVNVLTCTPVNFSLMLSWQHICLTNKLVRESTKCLFVRENEDYSTSILQNTANFNSSYSKVTNSETKCQMPVFYTISVVATESNLMGRTVV